MKILIILDWSLWSGLFIALIYALVTILTERTRSAEAHQGLGVFLILVGLGFSAATGTALHWLAQKQSITVMVLMTLVLAWPLGPVVARPIIHVFKEWKDAHEKASRETLSAS